MTSLRLFLPSFVVTILWAVVCMMRLQEPPLPTSCHIAPVCGSEGPLFKPRQTLKFIELEMISNH